MKEEKSKHMSLLYVVVAVVIALGVGFFGGVKYQQTKSNNRGSRQFMTGTAGRANGGVGNTGNRMGFRPIAGEVLSFDAASMTVKLVDGSSKIVIMSDKTQVNKEDSALKSDIIIGTKVAVFGIENQDGSVTAQSVQINPVMRVETTPTQNK